jgi:hypothetical protein
MSTINNSIDNIKVAARRLFNDTSSNTNPAGNYLWIYIVVLSVVGAVVLGLFVMGLVLCMRRRRMAYLYQGRHVGVANF